MKVRRTAEGRQRPEKSTIRIREATAKIGGASALGEIHKYETAQLEQRVPAWDYQLPPRPNASSGERPPIYQARLDLRIPEPSGRGRMLNVDVGFADP